MDSIRMTNLIKLLILNSKQILTPGPTGTSKTANITNILTKGFG